MTILCFALAFINTTLFFVLSAIHFYWAFGGKAGMDNVVPVNEKGKRMLNPGPAACTIVGLFLVGFAVLFLNKVEQLRFDIPRWLYQYGILGISAIFLLRAIGDFKYVGFGKKIKNTAFAVLYTKYYSPLCLLISVNGFVLEMILKTLPKI